MLTAGPGPAIALHAADQPLAVVVDLDQRREALRTYCRLAIQRSHFLNNAHITWGGLLLPGSPSKDGPLKELRRGRIEPPLASRLRQILINQRVILESFDAEKRIGQLEALLEKVGHGKLLPMKASNG
jgi:hypothetical protein